MPGASESLLEREGLAMKMVRSELSDVERIKFSMGASVSSKKRTRNRGLLLSSVVLFLDNSFRMESKGQASCSASRSTCWTRRTTAQNGSVGSIESLRRRASLVETEEDATMMSLSAVYRWRRTRKADNRR